jgi:hypothetical protein
LLYYSGTNKKNLRMWCISLAYKIGGKVEIQRFPLAVLRIRLWQMNNFKLRWMVHIGLFIMINRSFLFMIISYMRFRHIFHLAITCLSEKFSKLELQQFQQTRIFLPRFCPGPPLENLSSKVFTSKELSILAKGSTFAMAQTHVNT